MAYADDHPGYRISTEEDGNRLMAETVDALEKARAAVDVQRNPGDMRKAFNVWQVKHGSALGTVTTLHRCGCLGDVAYNLWRERVMRTMLPTIISPGG